MAQAATITEAQLRRVLQYISTRRHALRDQVAAALPDEPAAVAGHSMGGKIAMLGIPSGPTTVDWNRVIFKSLTIKGIYGREMYETWYQMSVMLECGLNIKPVITHRFHYTDFEQGFAAMESGNCGKVVLDWANEYSR